MKFSTQDQRSAPSRLRNAICDHCETATVHIDDGTESFGHTVLQCVPCAKRELDEQILNELNHPLWRIVWDDGEQTEPDFDKMSETEWTIYAT